MSSPEPKFCPARAEGPHFEPMHGYRAWLEIRDFASPADHSAIDV